MKKSTQARGPGGKHRAQGQEAAADGGAVPALMLAVFLIALLVICASGPASARDGAVGAGPVREDAGSGDESVSDSGKSAQEDSGEEGAGTLGVIVDIPEGWPLKGGDGADIVRFEKCFPFCSALRSGEGGADDGGESTVVESTDLQQTRITQETQTGQEATSEESTPAEYTAPEPTTSEYTAGESTMQGGQTTTGSSQQAACPTEPTGETSTVKVTRVKDGDSFEAEGTDGNIYAINLIGVDAPELDEPGGREAAAYTREALEGQELTLEYDRDKTDDTGTALAYAWMEAENASWGQDLIAREGEGELFNRLLVEAGHARAAPWEPNTAYEQCLARAELEARDEGAGIWSSGDGPGRGGSGEEAASPARAGAQQGTLGGVAIEEVAVRYKHASGAIPPLDPGSEGREIERPHAQAVALVPAAGGFPAAGAFLGGMILLLFALLRRRNPHEQEQTSACGIGREQG